MKELTEELLVSGLETPEAPLRTLRAGTLQVDYQSGFLRYIRIGKHEVLRLVNFALRDHNWETIPFTIVDEVVEPAEKSFNIQYKALFQSPEIDYEAIVRIKGDASGCLTISFDGLCNRAFRRNRIGFTVLHPLEECVGQELEATHTNGCVEHGHFPDLISPHQPLFDLSQLKWKVAGCEAILSFSGDVFEMEDQRNWTDASYKTYCTPLGKPFPVDVEPGDRVEQVIRLCVSEPGIQVATNTQAGSVVALSRNGEWQALPEIGVGRSRGMGRLSLAESRRLVKLGLDHYRVEIDPSDADWRDQFSAAIAESDAMGCPIELAVFLEEPSGVSVILQALQEAAQQIKYLLLLPKGQKVFPSSWIDELVNLIQTVCPRVKLGAGTDAFFTELNRERISSQGLDFLSYSINPQVHAFDNLSLVETLEAQGETVRTASSFSNGSRIHVGPISLRMRWNPNATEAEAPTGPDELDSDVDLRQLSLFGAAWTLGAIASLGRSGANSISLFEAVGQRGLMQSREPVQPGLFPVPAGEVYPVYHVLRELSSARSACYLDVSVARKVVAFLIETPNDVRLLLANLCAEEVQVGVAKVFEAHRIRVMDAMGWRELPGVRDGARFPGSAFGGSVCVLQPHAFSVLEGVDV